MSLILEALRKSEAERRRGQTPDLLTDAIPVARVAGRAAPNWTMLLPVIGAALITLLLVAWWLRPSAEPIPNGGAANDASADDRMATAKEAVPPAALNSATARVQASLSPPVIRPPAPAAIPASTPAAPALPATAKATPPAATTQDHAPAPAVTQPAPPLPAPTQVASKEQPAPAPAFASPDVPLRLSDLSSEDRAELPALKVSMHMWAPDAGNRFAIIDGARVNEGDRVGEATVEVIQQDGVMLSWRGRQIRLPIR